ncbi:MAG: hypothetical protein N2259_00570 [Patescibacteria group bacterium]|nr:hypothetical protein [Patescibacteria group bacterium]
MNVDSLNRFSYFRKNFQPESQKSKRQFFLISFFVLTIIFFSILVYFFISRFQLSQKEKSVDLRIERPETVVIGQNFHWSVMIKNYENSDLINAELMINFPQEDFFLKNIEPLCHETLPIGCLINLEKIKKNEQKEIKIEGKIFGQPGEKKIFSSTLTFQLANFSSWFKKETSSEFILTAYPFDWEIFNPTELMRGEEGEFRLTIKNNGQEKVETKIILISPEDFSLSFSEPEISISENKEKWWLATFEVGEEKKFDFKGFFSRQQEEERKFRVIIILVQAGKNYLQKEKEFILKVIQPGFVTGLRINQTFNEEQSANFGEMVAFNLSYRNISEEKFFDPLFKLCFNQVELLNLEKLSSLFWTWQSAEKKIDSNQWKIEQGEKKCLIWDKSQIKDLEGIEAGQEGEIIFSLKLKSYEEVSKNKPINPYLDVSFVSEANLFRRQTIVFQTEANKIKLKINSRVKIETEARYFSDEGLKIGSGPLPPRVGETTAYFIFLRPVNTTNEIKNIKIETILPSKVNWLNEERVSVGYLSFDNFSRKIIWQIDSIPSYAGGPYSFLEASFKIGLTPNEDDRGKILTLLEKTTFQAEDAFTGAKIYTEANPLDTNLEFDDWAKGRGVVE